MSEIEGELAFRLDAEDVKESNLLVLTIKDSCLNYSSTDTLKPAMKEIIQAALNRGRRNVVINMRSVGVARRDGAIPYSPGRGVKNDGAPGTSGAAAAARARKRPALHGNDREGGALPCERNIGPVAGAVFHFPAPWSAVTADSWVS